MRRTPATLVTLILLAAIACLLSTAPARGESAPAASPAASTAPAPTPTPDDSLPFVPVWIAKDVDLADGLRDSALAGVARQDPDPQNIVVLIHGWMNDRADSTACYIPTTEELRKLFAAKNQRVVVVGLQWDSYVGKAMTFVPQFAASLLGLAKNPYMSKVHEARKVGRHAARQLLCALEDKYPKAKVYVLGHSMGCEIAGHMVGTRMDEKEDKVPAFQEQRNLGLTLLCLAGSDLDSGIFSKAPKGADKLLPYLPILTWITVPKLFQGQQDNILALHAIERGQAAMGDAMPRMREGQWDVLIGGQRIYYDNVAIPPQHDWRLYYTPDRLARLVDAIFYMQDPAQYTSADLRAMAQAKAIPPDNIMALRQALSDPLLGVRIYILWRMETMLCGGPKHLADGTISKFCKQAAKDPDTAQEHAISNPCKVISQGFFPTPEIWTLLRSAARKKNQQGN
jgi:pimeloyl-ACP methyl ester carboxylesterase